MKQTYYPELVEWNDVMNFVRDTPYEDDFTISMYDHPEGAEIPGKHFRVRILPRAVWPTEENPDTRSYLVQSICGTGAEFVMYQHSKYLEGGYTREDIGDEAFDEMVAMAGTREVSFG